MPLSGLALSGVTPLQLNKQTVKRAILKTAFSISPSLSHRILAYRARRHVTRFHRKLGLDRIQSAFFEYVGKTVVAGPFAGMRHIGQSAGSMAMPKLVGCYELELRAALERVIARRPKVIIDVGAAEGYYAVGMALRVEEAKVYAFDTDAVASRLCSEMAVLNRVNNRVIVRGHCDAAILNELLSEQRALIISDCEGYEAELLDLARAPRLITADIIVELHDHIRAGITDELVTKFISTHDIELIQSCDRNPDDFPCLNVLPMPDRVAAVNEYRHGPQQWAVMIPRK